MHERWRVIAAPRFRVVLIHLPSAFPSPGIFLSWFCLQSARIHFPTRLVNLDVEHVFNLPRRRTCHPLSDSPHKISISLEATEILETSCDCAGTNMSGVGPSWKSRPGNQHAPECRLRNNYCVCYTRMPQPSPAEAKSCHELWATHATPATAGKTRSWVRVSYIAFHEGFF